MARSGSPYSTPRDANRVPLLVAASTVDGVTPVVLEADPTTHLLQVSSSGGGGGTQYVEGVTTTPATGNVFLGRYKATPPSLTDGQLNGLQVDSAGNLKVTGSLSVGGTTDNSAYTAGSSTGTPAIGFYHSTIDAVTDGRAAAVAITTNRASHTNLRNNSGTEVGTSTTPLQVSLANTAANATAVKVDGSAVTQPVSNASLPLPTGAATSANQATEITSLATIAALSKVEDAPHTTGDTGIPMWAVRNDNGTVFAGSDGDYIPFATDATGALRVDLNGTVSTNNSTTSVLAGGAAFTGTSEDALNYNEIRISVIASHVSATDGLSIQQSEDNTNWDFTDTYTIPATTGKTYSVPRQARYFRIVYTNGATLQTSFRLQTIMNRLGARVSSQRPNDAYTNETDLEQTQSFLMGYNGTTWDRLRTTGTGVLTTSTVLTTGAAAIGSLTAGSAIIGKVGIDQTTPGTTNLVALAANQTVNLAQVGGTNTVNGGVAGSQSVGGTVATNVAITANPINLGAQAVSSENSAATTARQVQLVADLVGKLIVLPYANPENFVSGTATATDTTSTSLVASPGGSLRNYITQFTVWNSSATNTYIKIQDGSGGTTLYTLPCPTVGGSVITLPTPLRQPTTATAIFFAANASANAVFISASGYKGL